MPRPAPRQTDPSNTFHEIRRYLLSLGLETRVGSYASVPLPTALALNADQMHSVDNFVFFEFRRIYRTETSLVNCTTALCRLFVHGGQDGKSIHLQLILPHKGHGLLEMNAAYHDLIQKLNDWTPVPRSKNIMGVEKDFESIHDFKAEFAQIHRIMGKHDLLNNHELSNEMQF
jgi:hypothetical protein